MDPNKSYVELGHYMFSLLVVLGLGVALGHFLTANGLIQ